MKLKQSNRPNEPKPCVAGLDPYTRWLAGCVARLSQRHELRAQECRSRRKRKACADLRSQSAK